MIKYSYFWLQNFMKVEFGKNDDCDKEAPKK